MTSLSLPGPLVATQWLADRLGAPGLVVMDASWYLPTSGRDPGKEYPAGHIPGAVRFDIDALSDPNSPLPHMMPDPGAFAAAIGASGVGDQDTVIVYDGSGNNLSAARAWWMFRAFGHEQVALLDGGFGKWKSEGRPLETGMARRASARFTARPVKDAVWTIEDVRRNIRTAEAQLVDARVAPRFEATAPEPRPAIRSGHVPGSRNLPYSDLVNPDGTFLPPDRLLAALRRAGIDPERPVVALCGSGTSACAVLVALETLGHPGGRIYDGSWTEWGGRDDTPIEGGPA
jgi:thiosulfate/3-mercaptopyruvate sulfurtransferase